MNDLASHEGRRHGSALFALSVYDVDTTPGPAQEVVNLHWHEEFECIVVKAGAVAVQVGPNLYEIHEGKAAWVHGGDIHAIRPTGGGRSTFYAIVFDFKLLSSASFDRIQHQYITPILEGRFRFPPVIDGTREWHAAMLSSLQQIITAYDSKPMGFEVLIKAQLLLGVFHIASADEFLSTDQFVAAEDDFKVEMVKHVLLYIEQHYTETIRLSDLAKILNVSTSHFCRFFHAMTGQTPISYVNEYRIQQAVRLLQTTRMPIMNVAFDCGFQNVSYFIKVFQSLKHCTPSEFRGWIT